MNTMHYKYDTAAGSDDMDMNMMQIFCIHIIFWPALEIFWVLRNIYVNLVQVLLSSQVVANSGVESRVRTKARRPVFWTKFYSRFQHS
jgi:hypothetical protein